MGTGLVVWVGAVLGKVLVWKRTADSDRAQFPSPLTNYALVQKLANFLQNSDSIKYVKLCRNTVFVSTTQPCHYRAKVTTENT